MRLKAKDTLHVSSVKADNIVPGEEFGVSDDIGRQLVQRGLATEVATDAQPASIEAKADKPPLNKMDPAPSNKSQKRKGK